MDKRDVSVEYCDASQDGEAILCAVYDLLLAGTDLNEPNAAEKEG